MNDFNFNCPHCGQSLEAPQDMLGEVIDCPSCNSQIEIPQPIQSKRPMAVAPANLPPHSAPSTSHRKSQRAPTLIILSVLVLLVLGGGAAFFFIGKDPHSVEVPSSVENWDDEDLQDAVEKLPEKEQELFASYAARVALATAFGAEGVIPEGQTVGKVIEEQRQWQKEQEEQEQRQALLTAELLKKQAEAQREMNDAVTVSLLDISWHKSDWQNGIVSDYFALSIGFKNRTSRDIEGIKGTVAFKDIFGDLIKGVRLSNDQGVAAGDTVVWNGTMKYNQFNDGDVKLRTTTSSKLKFEWEPNTYLFTDGTKMTMPTGTY